MSGLYDDPSVYDILHTPGTAREVDVLEGLERRWGRGCGCRGRWLEPACGTGRYLRVAAGRGLRVAGFDRDAAQIAYARRALRRRGLARRARLWVADMADFAGGLPAASCDLAFIPVNSLRHLTGDRAVLDHLAQVAGALRPGGIYVVGISLSRYGRERPDEDVWTGVRGRCRVTQVVNYLPPAGQGGDGRRETVLSHLMVTRPRGVVHRDDRYRLRTYDRRQWRALICRSALRHLASLNPRGQPFESWHLEYQLEVLGRRDDPGPRTRRPRP